MKQTKIIILAGFLGSGKTTVLQKLLTYLKEKQLSFAVVMNEIGEISIDTKLVGKETPVNEILNGCICCSSREQFEQAIASTIQNHHPDYLFVECSGVSHPYEVIDTCLNPLVSHNIQFQGVITVLDVPRFFYLKEHDEQLFRLMYEQARYADTLLLTKTEQLTADELFVATEQLAHYPFVKGQYMTSAKVVLDELMHKDKQNNQHELSVGHMHIQTLHHTFEHTINKEHFEDWLRSLDESILRIKGFITFDHDEKTTYLFQYAFGVPLYQPYDMHPKQNIVVIGKDINKENIKDQLAKL